MKIEVLVSTMFYDLNDLSFLDTMNIQSDVIIGNQCNENDNASFEYNGHCVTILSRSERGVGRNRNCSLFFSDADVVIFADNDVSYVDGYKDIVTNYYLNHPEADVVIFNFKQKRGTEELQDINKLNKRAGLRDITKFGAWAVTARRENVLKERISFSLLFGGGAKYSCGEDTLFLVDCYKRGLEIHLCDQTLGTVVHTESTWFKGINEKYVFDKGVLFRAINPRIYALTIIYHAIKHRKTYAAYGDVTKVILTMLRGAKSYYLTE